MSYWQMVGNRASDREYAEQLSSWENEGGALRHRPERFHDVNYVAASVDATKGAVSLATSHRKKRPLHRVSKAANIIGIMDERPPAKDLSDHIGNLALVSHGR
jgi:hypothetical protein